MTRPIRFGDETPFLQPGHNVGSPSVAHIQNLIAIIDNYESGDIAEYYGHTAKYDLKTTTVFEGDAALYGQDSSSNNASITSTQAGLENYPAKGDTFRIRIFLTNSTYATGVFFAVQDDSWSNRPTGYLAELNHNASKLQIVQTASNTFSTLTSAAQDWSPYLGSEWLDVEIQWALDDTLTVTVFDESGAEIQSTSVVDNTHSDNVGIGNWIRDDGTGHDGYFDNFRVI